jgi:hypothetical protein
VRVLRFILLLFTLLVTPLYLQAAGVNLFPYVVLPSGGDDTQRLQTACNANGGNSIVELVAGQYNVSTVNCRNIVSQSTDAFFYYQGQQPSTKIKGLGGTAAVVTCQSPGPCAYRGFTIDPGPGQIGLQIGSNTHGVQLYDLSIIDDQGGGSSDCVQFPGNDNQNLVVRGGTYEHCGGWCFNMVENLSDSSWYLTDIANCADGGVFIGSGFGDTFVGNRIQDQYSSPGVWIDGEQTDGGSGTIVFDGNIFDSNSSDIIVNNLYLVASGNMDCRVQVGGMFEFRGNVAINASANMSCGPTYLVDQGANVSGAIYDPFPSYANDGGFSQAKLSGIVRQ